MCLGACHLFACWYLVLIPVVRVEIAFTYKPVMEIIRNISKATTENSTQHYEIVLLLLLLFICFSSPLKAIPDKKFHRVLEVATSFEGTNLFQCVLSDNNFAFLLVLSNLIIIWIPWGVFYFYFCKWERWALQRWSHSGKFTN